MTVEILTQFQDRGLADARHQESGKIFGDSFCERETEQQQGDGFPGSQTGVGNRLLQTEESLRALAAAFGEGLIENGDDERADRDFQQADEEHRKRGQRESFPVRLDVSEQSLKIAHRQF